MSGQRTSHSFLAALAVIAVAAVLLVIGQGRSGGSEAGGIPGASEAHSGTAGEKGNRIHRGFIFSVTSTRDAGPGSLRQAILDANAAPGADTIRFAIPFDGPHVIRLASPLPLISDSVAIDGYAQPGSNPAARRELPAGLRAAAGAHAPTIVLDGSAIESPSATVGETPAPGERAPSTEFAAPAFALRIDAPDCLVRGLTIEGFAQGGIAVSGPGRNTIEQNVLRSNGGPGVIVLSGGANAIRDNAIVATTGPAIDLAADGATPNDDRDLDAGPNDLQNAPELISIERRRCDTEAPGTAAACPTGWTATVAGTLDSRPDASYSIELFATRADVLALHDSSHEGADKTSGRSGVIVVGDPAGASTSQAESYLGTALVTTGADGRADFTITLPTDGPLPPRALVAATATDLDGNTSELSASVAAPASVISWAAAVSGNWNDGTKWTGGVAPGAADDAVINVAGTYTVTVNVAVSVNSLSLGGPAVAGTQTLAIALPTLTISAASTVGASAVLSQTGGIITGTGNLTVNGNYDWSGGTQSGSGSTTIAQGATLDITGTSPTLSRTLNNAGTTNWNTTNTFVVNTPGVFNNQATGVFNVQNSQLMGNTGDFINTGTFNKTAGALTTINTSFDNTGTVNVDAGSLSLRGGGNDTGPFDATGFTLIFDAGTHTLSGGASIVAGTLEFSGGTVTTSSSVSVTGTTITSGAMANLNGSVPSLGTQITITGGTLNLNNTQGSLSVANVTHSGGTLGGTSDVTVTGAYNWTGGTQSGAGTTIIPQAATLTIGGTSPNLTRTLSNAGTTTWNTTSTFVVNTPGVFTNQATGVFNVQNSQLMGNTGDFINAGTFNKTAGALTTINTSFDNTGTVNVDAGSLSLRGGGNDTGPFDATGFTLIFDAGTHTLSGGASIVAGTLEVSGGTVTTSSSVSVTGTTITSGATANLNGSVPSLGTQITITGGTLNLNNTQGSLSVANVTHSGGTLGGTSDVTVTGAYNWTGGTQSGAGTTIIPQAATLTIGGTSPNLTRTLNNAGTATWNTTSTFVVNAPGVFNNQATGVFNVLNSQLMGNTGDFINAGTFNKTAGALTTINTSFDNTGTVNVNAGSLSLRGGGTDTGPFDATGFTLIFDAGTHALSGGASIAATTLEVSGGTMTTISSVNVAGSTTVSGGTANFLGSVPSLGSQITITSGTLNLSNTQGSLSVATVTHSAGTLGGTSDLTVTGTYTWNGGSQSGTGATTIPQGATLNLGGASPSLNRTLNNAGTTNWNTSSTFAVSNPAVFNNQATGVINVQNAQIMGNTGILNNAGTFNKSSGGTTTINSDFNNSGTVNASAGNLDVSGGFVQTTGTLVLNGGTLSSIFLPLEIHGGVVKGNGTINAPVNVENAAISPGSSAGSIAIVGDYAQSVEGGTYTVEIGGLTPATQHDQVAISGAGSVAVLGGVLNVTLINAFTPAQNDTFTVMTFPSQLGNFHTVNLPPLGGGLVWNVLYSPTSLVLSVGLPGDTADLSLTKFDGPDPVTPNGLLSYSLLVDNDGPDTATNLTVTDQLPPEVTNATASGAGWTCNPPAGGSITCTRPSLVFGATAGISITCTAPQSGTLSNTASVTSATADPNLANNQDTETTTVSVPPPSADLAILKNDTADPVASGGVVSYSLLAVNNGPATASNVSVVDTLPAGMTGASASGTGWSCGLPVGQTITCTRASMAAFTNVGITVQGTAPIGPDVIFNTASISSTTSDPDHENNGDIEDTTIEGPPTAAANLAITKTDSVDPVAPATAFSYTVTVSNGGPDTATNLVMGDNIPVGLTNVSASGTGWTCGTVISGLLTCTRPTLASGASSVITVLATSPVGGGITLTNTVGVGSDTNDPNTDNNVDLEQTFVSGLEQEADLAILKHDSIDPVAPSTPFAYTLAVANQGPATAVGVSVADSLPDGLSDVVAFGTGWTCGPVQAGIIICSRPNLAVGAAPPITVSATSPPTGGTITNQAGVTSQTDDPNTQNNLVEEDTLVGGTPTGADLTILKIQNPDPVQAGQPLTFTLTVTNLGPQTANRVVVKDRIPAGLTGFRGSGPGWECGKTGRLIACTRASLAAGTAPPITIRANAPGLEGIIENTAEVSSRTADPNLSNNAATSTTGVTPVHDLAIKKIGVEPHTEFANPQGTKTRKVFVKIQNRSPHPETITDLAMLGQLVTLNVESFGPCPAPAPVLVVGEPQPALPKTLAPKDKISVFFDLTFDGACMNDTAKSTAANPGHDDFGLTAVVHHSALDGAGDTHPVDDVCPRSVLPPSVPDPYPNNSIEDKGCGRQKADGTFGLPVTVDLYLR